MTNNGSQRRIAMLLGATAGVGPALVEALGMMGLDLVLIGSQRDKLSELAKQFAGIESSVTLLGDDLDDPAELRRVVREAKTWLTRIDVLVCNAAPQHFDPGCQRSLCSLNDQGFVNLEMTAEMCKEILPGMIKRHKGRIVLIPPVYCADELKQLSRGGGEKPFSIFGRRLAEEIGRSRVTVNSIVQVTAGQTVASNALKEQARIMGLPSQTCSALFALQDKVSHLTTEEQMQAVVRFVAGKSSESINGLQIPVCIETDQLAVA